MTKIFDAESIPLNSSTGFYPVGGKRLEYVWLGPKPEAALTLVFLHEGLGCVALWQDFPEQVARATGCGVLVYSRAGYGASDPVDLPRPLSYMHDEGLKVLPALLDAAGVRNAVLVGHSDGSSIALIHAGGVTDPRIKGLVLMAPHVFVEPLSLESIANSKVLYTETDLRQRLKRYHDENVDCAFWGWNDAWLAPAFVDWNIEKYLSQISVPTLLIQGQDDQYGTELQLQAIASQIAGPVSTVLLERCGHSPFRDQPKLSQQALVDFIPTCRQ
ncbi:alpha/beta fold hydrolase [Amphritea balenae]|uniref:Alpha/beta hydrolase n=1 Tax=Amphritea balenae TaxID=452629 RepID=A0A3P1SM85_9GAMM|nr:alpha/beta hydrolase [Amphritea balenae]RRC98059.1 alpha/beta hydrolase [Amphritea balenae]GGK67192.1 hydrolase [Amphritea balenae]